MNDNNSKDKALAPYYSQIETMLKQKSRALPSGFNQTRFLQNAITVLADTNDIQKMDPKSVARTIIKGAFLGLDFFLKECYAIPYGNELQFQTDWRGEIKIAKRWSTKKIRDIYAKCVRKGDQFEEIIDRGIQTVNFKPRPFNDGQIIGVFAVCLYEDGNQIYESMSSEQVDRIRLSFSKMPNGKAWKDSWPEMARKTVIRRLRKYIDLNFDDTEQIQAYEEGGDAKFDPEEAIDIEPVKMPEKAKLPEKARKPSEGESGANMSASDDSSDDSFMDKLNQLETLRAEKLKGLSQNVQNEFKDWYAGAPEVEESDIDYWISTLNYQRALPQPRKGQSND